MKLCSLPVIYLGPNCGGGNEDNGDLPQKIPGITALVSAPIPAAGHLRPPRSQETPRHPQASPGQFLMGSLLLSPASWCTRFCCALQESVSQYDFPVYFPMNNMKRQKDRTLRDELPRLAVVCCRDRGSGCGYVIGPLEGGHH